MIPGIGSLTGSLTNSGSLDLSAGPSTSGDAKSGSGVGYNFGGINNSKNTSPLIILGVFALVAIIALK